MNSKTMRHTQLSLWYTTAAVAAVGGGLAYTANEAAAGIVSYTSGLAVPTSPSPPGLSDTTQGVWFDFLSGESAQTNNLPNGAQPQFRLQWLQSFGSTYLYQSTAGNTAGITVSFFYPSKLNKGDSIGPGLNFDGPGPANPIINANASAMSLVGSFGGAQWGITPPSPTGLIQGYLGLRFESGGNFNYGWAEVSIANSQPTLVAFGYENVPNTPILAGALAPPTPVPEPNPLLLLATGAAGLGAYRAWRARRDQRRAPEPVTA